MLSSAHAQFEDPLVVGAVTDAVKRHPNLVEVTVREGCSGSISAGVVKGVLQKPDVHKVNVMKSLSLDRYSKITAAMNRECLLASILSSSGFTFHLHYNNCTISMCGFISSCHERYGPKVPHTCNEE